jgi:hypothetical protein
MKSWPGLLASDEFVNRRSEVRSLSLAPLSKGTMKKLNLQEYKDLRARLYRAMNALSVTLREYPELADVSVILKDGHRLRPNEIISWIETVRESCWQRGPADVQRREIQRIVGDQPRG